MKFFKKNDTIIIIVSKIQICERVFVIHITHRVNGKYKDARKLGQRRLSYGILVDLEAVWG